MRDLPTSETYTALQNAYDYFNEELFDAALPACLITLQRRKRTYGYFLRERFVSDQGRITDEIAMNPQYFDQGVEETLSTLVHEMVHLWQAHQGSPGRRGYHNRQWAEKMWEVGLHPTHDGTPTGRTVGERVTHLIMPEGAYKAALNELLATDFRLAWRDAVAAAAGTASEGEGTGAVKKQTRTKYRCPRCELQAWAKPAARLLCGGEHCEATQLEPCEEN